MNSGIDSWANGRSQYGICSVYHPLGTDTFAVTRGQTVFHITDYFNGYFTGAVVVKLSEALVPNCQYVLGQVTPEGRLYMTMYNAITGEVTQFPDRDDGLAPRSMDHGEPLGTIQYVSLNHAH